ncbi:rap guanine nucleotide exchange factor 1-like isoform X1 [Acipenser ruthenus]|uniref:rap guanine nucleotide exchange factor 1-like isoform X1 n=1 Tax=Acipenser ruthenus TaxID=7906 RepID=UPI00274071E1|nr:rap guanine nucleotide exchange factor 1-like isoform X1 [Acipenser ruthenus]
MSGKIEKQDSQRSHLTSFTMKLMDKFHSPKIKRTPSKKGKQQQPEPTVKAAEKPVNKNVSRLEEHEKEVVSALRYFKTIVDKMVADKRVLEMLPGSASKVLEAILPLVQVEPRIQQRVTGGSAEHIKPFSSAVSSCHNRVYQSLANLIRWSDQVMLEGVNLDDKETVLTVTVVIKAVLDGVKELVKLTIEKQEHPSPASPASPVKQISPACKSEITTELPLTEREKEILHKTTPMTRSLEILPDAAEEDVAPPKPPLPGIKVNEHSPPALPPKKRQSAPSPTRVAVVAPMSRTTSGSSLPIGISKQEYDQDCLQRRLSSGSRSYGGESPRLSPCNSIGKLSKSDEQLSSLQHDSGQCSRNTSCETLDNTENYDPDYDFLHQDLSNADQVPHTVPSGVLSPLPESHSESPSHFPGQPFRIASPQPLEYCRSLGSGASPQPTPVEIPPALPQKKRRSAASLQSEGLGSRVSYERHPSQYDNISEDDLPVPPFPVFAAVSPLPQGIATIFSADFNTSVTDDIPESPPPLPEKKSKHIQQYMQFLEDYSEPQPSVFYQTPQSESIYEQRNKRFQEAYGFNDSFSSTDSVHELLPPPRLPPKQRQLASYNASSSSSSSSSSLSCHVQHAQAVVPVEDANAALSLSMSVSNSFLSRHSSFTAPSLVSPPLSTPPSSISEEFPFPLYLPPTFPSFDPAPMATSPWPFPLLPPSLLHQLVLSQPFFDPTLLGQCWLNHPFFSQLFLSQLLHNQSNVGADPVWIPESPPLSAHLESLYKSVYRSYSQDFAPHNQASIPPFLSPVSSHFTTVHQSQSLDLAAPATAGQSAVPGGVANGSQDSSGGSLAVCPPSEPSLPDSLQTSVSESANEEGGEGEYVNLYSSSQVNGELPHSRGDPAAVTDDALPDPSPQKPSTNSKENAEDGSRRQKSTDSDHSDEEVDELSLIDHKEIMTRITLKQEVRDRVCASDQDLSAIIEHVEPSLRSDDGPDVRAGSGDILLVHATETDRKDLVLYCEAFLTTYRTFITPEDLIKKLHYRYTRFCHSPDTFKKRVSKNTFFVLVRVVDELCLVELTDDILKQLMDLVFRLVCSGELSLARVLRKNILDKVDQKKQLRYINSMKPLAARGVAARPGTLHDFRSHEIADQLTLLDAELFYKIEIPEVLLWAKEQNEEKSPNLTQFTEHFNNMSYWVRSIIILQEKAQDREKLLLKFIKIMKHLRKLNNFNSYLAILSALDSAPIRRLEWQKQTSEGLEEYCTLIDSSSSFRAYRAALAEVEPPCIPYLGLILQDLTFVHLGNPDLIDGKVNFSKRWQQFNILDSMRRFQQVHYELKRNDDIVSFFNDFSDHLAEEALWELSLKIKPRNITRRKTEREEKT